MEKSTTTAATVKGSGLADAALWYARVKGWKVVPLHHMTDMGACSCRNPKGDKDHDYKAGGKHPIGKQWTETATNDPVKVAQTWARNPWANIGIATGEDSGIFVLDVDPDSGGFDTLDALEAEHGTLPVTWVVETGSGGMHYYFQWPDFDLRNSAGKLGPGLDIRGNGGQVVAAPSVSGKGAYTSTKGDVAAAPEWLLGLLKPKPRPQITAPEFLAPMKNVDAYTAKLVENELNAVVTALDGTQNDAINKAAYSIGSLVPHGVLSEVEAHDMLMEAARQGGHPEGRARSTVESGLRAGISSPRSPWPPVSRDRTWIPAPSPTEKAQIVPETFTGPVTPSRSWDDMGNAERLVDHYGHEIRFVQDSSQWCVYTKGRWSLKGADSQVWQRVMATIDALPDTEASEYDDTPQTDDNGTVTGPSEQERFRSWVRRQRMRGALASMRECATGRPELHCMMSDFDKFPMLFNCSNGIVDLETGKLMPHDRVLMLMQQSTVVYDPEATCPEWERFLSEVMPDLERREYLRRIVGYTLTGSTAEQVMFIHHGEGANGKSVFIQVVMALMGEYAQSVPRSTLLAKSGDGIPNDIARMMGKRLLSTTETSAGKRLDDELVKQLTGQDTVSARFMRAEFFDFKPVGKIHLATNYLPHIGGGHGIARRLHDIGWDVTIPVEKRDAQLADRIIENELSGILNWALRGAREWRAQGLAVPEAVKQKTKEHVASGDPLAMWLDENTGESSGEVETRLLYANYKMWCETGGLRPMAVNSFGMALKERAEDRGMEIFQHPRTRRSMTRGIRIV